MALTLTIAGVDRSAMLRDGSMVVEKIYAAETCDLRVLDRSDSTSTGYRPAIGDMLRLLHGTDLLFGGVIVSVRDESRGDGGGTLTRITARDWTVVTERIVINEARLGSQGLHSAIAALVATYLAPMGFTLISASSGGPVVPAVNIDNETLADVLYGYTEHTGYVFRINGDKQCAMVRPGELPGPVTLDGTNLMAEGSVGGPVRWTQEGALAPNRLHFQTGTPTAGAGPVQHVETRIANGIANAFPVNVVPNHKRAGRIANEGGYTAGASSLVIGGLTPTTPIATHNTCTIDGQATVYAITGAVAVDDEGKVTLAISPNLTADVEDGVAVTFSKETGIVLEVNGTPTAMDGSTWAWGDVDVAPTCMIGPPPQGTSVVYRIPLLYPATMRVWEVYPEPVNAAGAFNRAVLVDGRADGSAQTNVVTAADWGRQTLAGKVTPPKIITCATRVRGHYPLLSSTVYLPDQTLAGQYLISQVRVRAVGIDPGSTDDELVYELELIEGDALGQSWLDYFKGRNPTLGIKWGARKRAYLLAASPTINVLDGAEPVSRQTEPDMGYDFDDIAPDVDVITLLIEHYGIPWPEFLAGTTPDPSGAWTLAMQDMADRATATGKPINLQVVLARGHAAHRASTGGGGELVIETSWDDEDFTFHDEVSGVSYQTAYIRAMSWLYSIFEPAYFNVGVEINIAWKDRGDDADYWASCKDTINATYAALKALAPSCVVYISAKIEDIYGGDLVGLHGFDADAYAALDGIDRDRFGLSMYPSSLRRTPADYAPLIAPSHLPSDYVRRVRVHNPDEAPLLIAETGWNCRPFSVYASELGCIELTGATSNHAAQYGYLQYLLTRCGAGDTDFLGWFGHRDVLPAEVMPACYPLSPASEGHAACTLTYGGVGYAHETDGSIDHATFEIEVPADATAVVVGAKSFLAASITGASVGASAMTLVGSVTVDTTPIYLFLLTSPPTGTQTVTVQASANEFIGVVACTLRNIATSGQPDVVATDNTGTGTNYAPAIVVDAQPAWVVGIVSAGAGITPTPSTSTTRRAMCWTYGLALVDARADVVAAGSRAVTLEADSSPSGGWASILVSLPLAGSPVLDPWCTEINGWREVLEPTWGNDGADLVFKGFGSMGLSDYDGTGHPAMALWRETLAVEHV